MKILLACYHSKFLHDFLLANGHTVVSCDFKKAKHSGKHYQCDVRELFHIDFDFMFAFPAYTYLCKAQNHLVYHSVERQDKQREAASFFRDLWQAPFKMIAIENPIGYINTHVKAPSQIVYPWMFGDLYSKDICLWLRNVPPLISTLINPVRKSVRNHTNSRMTQDMRSVIRSSWDHFPLMCAAIANQWAPPPLVYPTSSLLTEI